MEINKIYNECCLETMQRMGDKSIDLVVTSPPYNMRTRIRNGQYTTREKGDHFSKKYKHFGDDLSIEDFYKFHYSALKELLRVSKVVCYNFQVVTGSKEAFFKIIGVFAKDIKDVIIWDKGHGQPAMHEKVLNAAFEVILILEGDKKSGRVIQNAKFSRGSLSNVIRVGRGKKESKTNSAVFPEKIAGILINAFSSEDDIVYDPFSGSGTTAVVSSKLHRKYIGSEISKIDFEQSVKRLSKHFGLFTKY